MLTAYVLHTFCYILLMHYKLCAVKVPGWWQIFSIVEHAYFTIDTLVRACGKEFGFLTPAVCCNAWNHSGIHATRKQHLPPCPGLNSSLIYFPEQFSYPFFFLSSLHLCPLCPLYPDLGRLASSPCSSLVDSVRSSSVFITARPKQERLTLMILRSAPLMGAALAKSMRLCHGQ